MANNNRAAILLFLALLLCHGLVSAIGFYDSDEKEDWKPEWEGGEGEEEERGSREGSEWFLLQNSKRVVQTDAGEMRIVRSHASRVMERPMHLGFITMEPQSLYVPQYLDSNLIIFVRTGEARIGFIYRDDLSERKLQSGDVYRIPAGSAFYLLNTAEGQRLHVICSIDTSESLGLGAFRSFYIAGGNYPTSILSGFEQQTLATAFNVTMDELSEVMSGQQGGPIVYVNASSHSPRPSMWEKFAQLKEQDRLHHLKRMVESHQESNEEESEKKTWSWRKLLDSVFRQEDGKTDVTTRKSPDSYNIYERKADFKNNYGWSVALDESDYKPLKHSGVGVYLVNLTAGAMMAPHVNPSATEYGIVLRGSGSIQIVYPNGTQALNAKVKEGDVFWVPRYFPFCQIASRTGPFEFFGFTTSARRNQPQFLVGSSSLLQTFRGPELAAAFGISEDKVRRIIDAQREAVILPSASAAPPDETETEKKMMKMERVEDMVRSFGNDMVMGFD